MPITTVRDADGIMQPYARCAYGPCETPSVPMPHDDTYTRRVDPKTGAAAFEPLSVRLPDGWERWHSSDREELLLCPECCSKLRPVFGLGDL